MQQIGLYVLAMVGAYTVLTRIVWPLFFWVIESIFFQEKRETVATAERLATTSKQLHICLNEIRGQWYCNLCVLGTIVRVQDGVRTTLFENNAILDIATDAPLYRHVLLVRADGILGDSQVPNSAHYLIVFTSLSKICDRSRFNSAYFTLAFARWVIAQHNDINFDDDDYLYGEQRWYNFNTSNAEDAIVTAINKHEGGVNDYEHVLNFLEQAAKPSHQLQQLINDNKVIENGNGDASSRDNG